MKRIERDVLTIKRTIENNTDKFKTLGVFFLEKNTVLQQILAMDDGEIAKIAADCRENGVRWRLFLKSMNKAEKELLGDTEIKDISLTEETLPAVAGTAPEELVKVHPTADGVKVSFGLTGTFDILGKMNRNGKYTLENVTVTPDTKFTVVNELLPFWEDRYSLALKNGDLWCAVSVEDPKIGRKGSACVKLYVKQDGILWIDDLGKYTDVTEMLRWINP